MTSTWSRQPVAIVGLGDQGGNLALVSAPRSTSTCRAQTAAKGDPLHIVRTGDFVLAPDAGGAWKVTALQHAS